LIKLIKIKKMGKEKITEAMIIAYLQSSGGYDVYQKAIDDLTIIREAAHNMIKIYDGNVELAILATKKGQNKIIDKTKRND